MDISRINVKVFMDQGADVATETWFEVFNTWIHEPDNDVLVDVADYTHVENGPQTILVGHNANYALDTTDGRFGFLYARKRGLNGSLDASLKEAISCALKSCKRLSEDERLGGQVNFNGESIQIALNDRLGATNDAQTRDACISELNTILDKLYAGSGYKVTANEDARKTVTLDISAEGQFSAIQLLENLGS